MSRKKIDLRVSNLIQKCVFYRHRTMIFILGEAPRDQVVMLYHLLHKFRRSNNMKKPIPLWCFKKELGFNMFHNKKIKKLRKNYAGNYELKQEDIFEHFLLSSNLQVCHYSETDKILGQTFGMLIIQDFNAITPNTLARIVESVEGGGIIVYLLSNINSLEDLYLLNMDAHAKYVTEAYNQVSPLFNKRFVSSLSSCENCLVLDEKLKVKLIPNNFNVASIAENMDSVADKSVSDDYPNSKIGTLLSICRTCDQTNALNSLSETFKIQAHRTVTSLTSARGRGKSAVLGLAIAAALEEHLSNIYVTSPHLENVQTLFTFIVKGLQALNFVENLDYKVSSSDSNSIKFIKSIQVFKEHRQSVNYLPPLEYSKLGNADLVVIDEAAAISLTIVENWIGPYNVWIASTINGYEGTGRSLSLKLISQLRNQNSSNNKQQQQLYPKKYEHKLQEITLNEAIRYAENDTVEAWLNNLLCLDASTKDISHIELPKSEDCQLYYINKAALFSGNKYAEEFLLQVISLFVASHYKNTPNDLLMMADAPAHQMFCLLHPTHTDKNLPTVLCVIQVALEGKISTENYNNEQSQGRRASGDLIPWIISQQFQEERFISLSGARIVRIATHPNCQKSGYGWQSIKLLSQFYDGSLRKLTSNKSHVEDNCTNAKGTLPLLVKLEEMDVETLDYIGVSYGLTSGLLKFWKKCGFLPLYLRQTTSEVTGEHSCVMIKVLKQSEDKQWLQEFYADFIFRFVSLLPSAFSSFSGTFALSILHNNNSQRPVKRLSASELQWFISIRYVKRLEAYCNNLIDYHMILDILPGVSKLYFSGLLSRYFLSSVQEVVLLCTGLQNKTIEITAEELNMEIQQVMGCFRKTLKKIVNCLNDIYQNEKMSTLDYDIQVPKAQIWNKKKIT